MTRAVLENRFVAGETEKMVRYTVAEDTTAQSAVEVTFALTLYRESCSR